MKRFRKALLALAALLSVVVAGGFWLIKSTLNVASDAVDLTLDGAQKVRDVARGEIAGAEPSSVAGDKPAPALTQSTPTALPATPVPDPPVIGGTSPAPSPSAKPKDAEDNLAQFGDLLSLFLSDGEDASDLTAPLTVGDKAEGKNADDTLMDMIPGANSPTVKGWMDGKYKGKESQALDDAIEDPKLWRLVFFLSNGM